MVPSLAAARDHGGIRDQASVGHSVEHSTRERDVAALGVHVEDVVGDYGIGVHARRDGEAVKRHPAAIGSDLGALVQQGGKAFCVHVPEEMAGKKLELEGVDDVRFVCSNRALITRLVIISNLNLHQVQLFLFFLLGIKP